MITKKITTNIKKVFLKPEDTIIIESEERLDRETAIIISDKLKNLFPNNKIIILDKLKMKVVTNKKTVTK